MCECSPWKMASSPAASTLGATSRIEIVVSLVIRLAPMRTAGLLAARRAQGTWTRSTAIASALGAPARGHLDRFARNERAAIRGQEQDGVRDLLRIEPSDVHRVHRLVPRLHQLLGRRR